MPLYEFQCPTCGCIGEVQRKMADSDKPLFCDGTGVFDDLDDSIGGHERNHDPIEMKHIVSRLAVARVVGKRYA